MKVRHILGISGGKDSAALAIYLKDHAKSEMQKIPEFIGALYRYFNENPEDMPEDMQDIAKRFSVERAVCDYIAGMTDKYAVEKYESLFVPHSWNINI